MAIYKGNNLIAGAMPNSADTTLSNVTAIDANSAVQAALDSKVSKSGDTMNGALTIDVDYSNQLVLVNPYITKGTNPYERKYYGIYFNDTKNLSPDEYLDTRIGCIETNIQTNGTTQLSVAACQNAVGDNVQSAVLRLQVTATGATSCTFPNTTCCDGQWVAKASTIMSGVSAIGSGGYSISNYLPDNTYSYWVMARMFLDDDGNASSGTDSQCAVGNVANPYDTNCLRLVGAADKGIWKPSINGLLVFPAGQRTVYYQIKSRDLTNGIRLYFYGYRRIGTNA